MGPAGRSKYLKAAADFREFCAIQSMSLAPSPEVDDALDQYQVHLFAGEKSRLRVAREAFYGVRYAFDLHNFHLPLSKASLEGFRKEDADASREPCPWEALVLAVLPIMEMGTAESVLASAALLLNFDAYARPGALCQLRGSSLLRAGSNRWCLIFFRGDQADTSKTGHARRHCGDWSRQTSLAQRCVLVAALAERSSRKSFRPLVAEVAEVFHFRTQGCGVGVSSATGE